MKLKTPLMRILPAACCSLSLICSTSALAGIADESTKALPPTAAITHSTIDDGQFSSRVGWQLEPFYGQVIPWAACKDLSDYDDVKKRISAMGGKIACATVDAPVSYHAPLKHGKTQLHLLRVATGNPATSKKRHLLFNPGGPGAPGLNSPLNKIRALMGEADSARADVPKEDRQADLDALFDQYNLIGFSPRGSTEMMPVTIVPGDHRSVKYGSTLQEEKERAEQNAKNAARAYEGHVTAPFVHSEAVAQDMELMRELLGDTALNFFGTSYGTIFGLWYAGLYPKHVGRFVLEGVVRYDEDPHIINLGQNIWRRNFIRQFSFPYAEMEAHRFASPSLDLHRPLPEGAQGYVDVDLVLPALSADWKRRTMLGLETPLISALDFNSPASQDEVIAVLLAARRATLVGDATGDIARDPIVNRFANTALAALKRQTWFLNGAVSKSNTPEKGAGTAFWCNDAQSNATFDELFARLQRDAGDYALADIDLLDRPCAFWPFNASRRIKPSLQNVVSEGADRNMLLLNAEWDARTTMEGALSVRHALPGARMIRYEQSTRHGVFPTGNRKVDGVVFDHLLRDTLPDKDVSDNSGSIYKSLLGEDYDKITGAGRESL